MDFDTFSKLRIALILTMFLFLFTMIFGRAVQLMFLSPGLGEIYNRQHAKGLEIQALIKELQQESGKITALQPSYDILREKSRYPEDTALAMQRNRLLKEINELNSEYVKLSNEIQALKERVNNLVAIEERSMKQIIDLYAHMHKSEKWFNFIINFLLGVFASILASIIYNMVAIKNNLPSIGKFIEFLKKIRPLKKTTNA